MLLSFYENKMKFFHVLATYPFSSQSSLLTKMFQVLHWQTSREKHVLITIRLCHNMLTDITFIIS